MKVKDLPKEIAGSEIFGEIIAWKVLNAIIDEIPSSRIKETILDLIETRQEELMELEL